MEVSVLVKLAQSRSADYSRDKWVGIVSAPAGWNALGGVRGGQFRDDEGRFRARVADAVAAAVCLWSRARRCAAGHAAQGSGAPMALPPAATTRVHRKVPRQ